MNKKTLPLLLLAVLFTIAYTSCKKADDKPVVRESDSYFPLEIGKYVIYNVDSTIWDDTNCVKIVRRYQMMYRVADTFTDTKGRASYRVDVSIRKKAEDPWLIQSVMYATNTGQELELSYSQLRFVKMIYPISEGRTWLGNAYVNTADPGLTYFNDWNYRYVNVDMPFSNGQVNYENTVTVMQIDNKVNDPETQPRENAIRTYSKEVFAKGVGMVYREYYRWTYDASSKNNTDPNLVDTRCLKGDGVILRAVDHN
ncbi:hypothetical protein CAP35_14820 [Chitinophagaceae bacterium IBVUCB1]|nr:hypothetical protein CAP35_14820 [Chitinophagaceae bacterium IBVUCB1]